MISAVSQLTNEMFGRTEKNATSTTGANDSIFGVALQTAQDLLKSTSEAEAVTTQLTYDFMTGKNEDVHSLLIAQEQGSILLQFTMQVRNKVMDAYNEIIRIPV